MRFHSLDAVRAAAMMLGLFFHGAISFMAMPTLWAVRDRSANEGVDLFVWVCHSFRLPLFFMMSGFFARLVYLRLGLEGFVRHRVRRILVPFLVALPPTLVAVYFLWRWGWSKTPPSPPVYPGLERISLDLSTAKPSPVHLWFLYYLMMLLALLSAFLGLKSRFPVLSQGARLDAVFERLARSWTLPLVLAIPTGGLLYFMAWLEADSPVSFVPQGRILAYYSIFMAFGWMLHRRPLLVGEFPRRIWLHAALAAAALPAVSWLLRRAEEAGEVRPMSLRIGGLFLSALFAWSMILLFIGVFVRWLSQPRPWVRWVADASYWCYLIHLPVVVFFQIVVAEWGWPGPLKYAFVMAATLAVCLGSYRAFVRYTILGRALNGKRERAAASGVETASAA